MAELLPTWCGCPGSVVNSDNYTYCSVCLGKYDLTRVPIGLQCGHTICRKCWKRVQPEAQGIPNVALLNYLDLPAVQLPVLEPDCISSICRLSELGQLLKSANLSRAITRKVVHLITSLTWNGQSRLVRGCRAVGERVLIELSTSCSHLSHYHAQQQLWAAIRSRACQFMGPAMQEEALKLVLLALEDGSPLSRKVLVMFVVQRLAPQFPQASKTSIGHVIQLLYRASSFDVVKRPSASSLMTLRPEFRNYTALRREHDTQIVKIALESGIRFSPEQWSSILYGDVNQKSHMQSIIDKLQAPQTFTQMTNEFLISIQRLNTEDTNYLLQAHPKFQLLASIEYQQEYLPWKLVCMCLESVHSVLHTLISFNAKSTGGGGGPNNSHGHGHRKKALVEDDLMKRQQSRVDPQPAMTVDERLVQELLHESKQLRARMREVQEKIPWAAQQFEEEAHQLDLESKRLEKVLSLK